jgi:hypothetical protein
VRPERSLEAVFYVARPQCRPSARRSGEALEFPGPEVLQLEQIAEQLSRALGDHDAVRLGDPLQTRSQVRCLANDTALLSFARSDQVADHHQASCNADPGLQQSVGPKSPYCRNQLQC